MKQLRIFLLTLLTVINTIPIFAEDYLKQSELREHCFRVNVYVGNGQEVMDVDALFVFNSSLGTIAYSPERKNGPTQYFSFNKYSYREFNNYAEYSFTIVNNDDIISVNLHMEKGNTYIVLHYTDFDAYFHADQGAWFPL